MNNTNETLIAYLYPSITLIIENIINNNNKSLFKLLIFLFFI